MEVNLKFYKGERIMPTKTVKRQLEVAVRMIKKEGWSKLDAIQAVMASIVDEISEEEFEFLLDKELGDTYVA